MSLQGGEGTGQGTGTGPEQSASAGDNLGPVGNNLGPVGNNLGPESGQFPGNNFQALPPQNPNAVQNPNAAQNPNTFQQGQSFRNPYDSYNTYQNYYPNDLLDPNSPNYILRRLCFAGDTKVWTSEGVYKELANLTVGEYVLSSNVRKRSEWT